MTFRARPAGSKVRPWEDRDRRNMLLNIGFGIIVVASVLLLAIAAGVAWYSDHLAEAGAVNGTSITKDQYRTQLAVDTFRNDYQERRLRTLLTAGQIRVSDYESRQSIVEQRRSSAAPLALERLIDAEIQRQLAETEGVSVTEADVDARFVEEATIPELRHIWVIEVEPEPAEDASEPGDEEIAAAKQEAEDALADLRRGANWEAVARLTSTAASKDQGGDLGFVDEDAALDPALAEALFAAELNTPTDVIEGTDGVFYIARVTEIIDAREDATLAAQLETEGIKLEDFRAALRADVVRARLADAVTEPYLAAGPQRRVAELRLDFSASSDDERAVRTRHILYSPKDDAAGAAALSEDDPAWKVAEDEARAAYETLKDDIDKFDALARAESDEAAAATTGGKLPYFTPDDNIDEDFAAAIFAEGLEDGQLLEPIRSSFGWHVIQIQHGPTDFEFLTALRDDIAAGRISWEDAVRDNSEAEDAAEGGDMGWIAKGIEQPEVETQVFGTAIGEVSQVLFIPNDATYIFYVTDEEVREPTDEQKRLLRQNVFPTWYGDKKDTFEIRRDAGITAGL